MKEGIITPETWLKMGIEQEWFKARDVKELFPEQESESTASAAAEALSKMNARRIGIDSDEEETTSLPSLNFDFSNFLELPGMLLEFLAERLSFLKYLFKLWIIIPLILAVVIGLFINFIAKDWYYDSIALNTYNEVWRELTELRDMKVSEQDWEDFKAKVQPEISKVTSAIEKSAHAKDTYRMELLRAGRDYLPKMLDDARESSSVSEEKFLIHIQRAQGYHQKPQISFSGTNIVTFLIILVDIVIVAWVIIMVRKKYFT